ncbi:MAG: molybdopterin cofactor-binding domain-containing protein, partial [Usitatibacter sp.]
PEVRYGGMVQDRLMFAKDVVRFEADVVAAVAATTPEVAAAACELIEVDYEPLPANSDIEAAIADNATLIHETWSDYSGDDTMGRDKNTLGHSTIIRGDAAAALASADAVVKGRYVADCSQGVPIEPRAIIAQWQGDKVTVWTSTQVPFAARSGVATVLEIPESHVRVIVPLLGGGFGSKCDFHFEGHIAALAKAARRPVKLVFSRHEEFIAPDHRREGIAIELETGVRRDGSIVARRGKLVLDKGAYCGEGGFFAQMAAMHACGPYKLETVDIHSYLNYTNNQPSSSIRAPTAPQVCWALEQHTDELANAIDMDPVEFRRRTLIAEGDIGPAGQVYEQIGMKETLAALARMHSGRHEGLAASLHANVQLLGSRGAVGMIAYAYLVVFECYGPLVEIAGYAFVLAMFAFGLLPGSFLAAYLAASFALGFMVSASALLLEEYSFRQYPRADQMARLVMGALIENLGYRQLVAFWRSVGLARWARSKIMARPEELRVPGSDRPQL